MKKPVVDYRKFRFSKLNAPEFEHLKLLGGWLVYFALYFLTENLIPEERLHIVHNRLDEIIPFREEFVLLYCSWFGLIALSLLLFMLYDIKSFRQLQSYIMVTQALAMITYILWPSMQDLRPLVMPRDNILTAIISFIYRFDTPTGVCPSLHVAYSMGIGSVWLRKKDASPVWKTVLVIWIILICMSVSFIKQHSTWDILAAVPVGMIAEYIVFYSPLKGKIAGVKHGSDRKTAGDH